MHALFVEADHLGLDGEGFADLDLTEIIHMSFGGEEAAARGAITFVVADHSGTHASAASPKAVRYAASVMWPL